MLRALLFAMMLPIAGCAATPGGEENLAGSSWILEAAENGPLAGRAGDGGVTLVFEAARLGGYGGCNRYGGDYTLEGATLRIGPLTATKRGCLGAGGEIEQAWHAALAGPLQWRRDGDRLTLTTADGQVLRLRAGKAETP